jgi:hypothetical protein
VIVALNQLSGIAHRLSCIGRCFALLSSHTLTC